MDENQKERPEEKEKKTGWKLPDLSDWPKEGDPLVPIITQHGPAAIQIVGGVRPEKDGS